MTAQRKTWAEKMRPGMQHRVKTHDRDFADIPAGHTFLIATPAIVDEYIRHIPKGQVASLGQMRKDLAADYHAEFTCPVTAGIFLRIVAENAWEQMQQGKKPSRVTPFWRMVDPASATAKKLACGIDFLKKMRKAEGLEP